MNTQSMKKDARALLIGNYAVLIAVSVLYELIVILVNNLFSTTSSVTALIASIAITLMAGILDAGVYRLYLMASEGQKITLADLIYPFTHCPDRYILMALFLLAVNVLLTLPFSILLPSWGAYLLMPFPFYFPALQSAIPLVLRIIIAILWSIAAIAVYLHFIWIYLIGIEDESCSVPEAIRRSISLMRGRLPAFAKLLFSFFGYLILGILTFGVGFLWIIPYFRMTTVCFYRAISQQS